MFDLNEIYCKIIDLIYIDLVKKLRDYKISRLDSICIASDFFDIVREDPIWRSESGK